MRRTVDCNAVLAQGMYAAALARDSNSHRTRVPQIGPGTGNLTKHLLARGAVVTAVEKDDTLYGRLTEEYRQVRGREQPLGGSKVQSCVVPHPCYPCRPQWHGRTRTSSLPCMPGVHLRLPHGSVCTQVPTGGRPYSNPLATLPPAVQVPELTLINGDALTVGRGLGANCWLGSSLVCEAGGRNLRCLNRANRGGCYDCVVKPRRCAVSSTAAFFCTLTATLCLSPLYAIDLLLTLSL